MQKKVSLRMIAQDSLVSFRFRQAFGRPSSLTVGTPDTHLQPIKAFACSNEQLAPIFPAKTDVSSPCFGYINLGYLSSSRIKDRHAFSCEIHIAFFVNGHPVGAELAEKFFIFESTIGINLVAISFSGSNICDVKSLAICSSDYPVGLLQIVYDSFRFCFR